MYNFIKEGHIRIIPAKFGKNPASSLGGDVFEAIVDNAGHTTDNGHPVIAIALLEPKAQVREKKFTRFYLKKQHHYLFSV